MCATKVFPPRAIGAFRWQRGGILRSLDADDVLEENALSILYQAAVKSGAQITSANHTLFDVERGCRVPVEIEPVVPHAVGNVREIITCTAFITTCWNKLYVRELFEDGLRLGESVHIGEDALLNLQLYLRAKNIAAYFRSHLCLPRTQQLGDGEYGALQPGTPAMLQSMSAILLREGVKELYFRDFLQSCVWVDEKETA